MSHFKKFMMLDFVDFIVLLVNCINPISEYQMTKMFGILSGNFEVIILQNFRSQIFQTNNTQNYSQFSLFEQN